MRPAFAPQYSHEAVAHESIEQRADVLAIAGISIAITMIYSNAPTVGVQFHGLPGVTNFIAPGLLALLAARAIVLQGAPIRLSAAAPWICVFMLTGFLGALAARNSAAALEELVTMIAEGVVLYLVVTNAIRSPRQLNAAFWAIIGSAATMSAIVIFQYLSGSFDNNFGGFGQIGSLLSKDAAQNDARLAGSIGEVNRFAQILAMALPVALVKSRSANSPRLRRFAGLSAIFILGGCAVTFSRGVMLGLVPTLLVAIWLGYLKPKSLLIGGLVALLIALALPSYRERIVSLGDVLVDAVSSDGLRTSDGAIRGRFASVGASLLVFADNPIIGVGPGQNLKYYQQYSLRVGGKLRPYPREAHSLIPQLLADWGLIGFIGFAGAVTTICAGLFAALRRIKTAKDSTYHLPAAILLVIVSYGGTSLFLHFSYVRYFWLVLGLGAAAIAIARTADLTTSPTLKESPHPKIAPLREQLQ